MGIRINRAAARRRLEEAVDWAQSDREVPARWVELTRMLDGASQKTYTPALGTALLAKATDRHVDPLSIKDKYSATSYSLRTLCHSVLVPAAVDFGFSLRNTGREPINNQPWFRYDHMKTIERVQSSARPSLEALRTALSGLVDADEDEALAALAAFLRVRFQASIDLDWPQSPEIEIPFVRLVGLVDRYLDEDSDRPKRTQALATAAFDLIFETTRSRKINDPSRDFPGDVQAFIGQKPIMAAEVRAKAVPRTEAISFVQSLRHAGISRGFLVVLHPSHVRLDRADLVGWAWSTQHVVLTLMESVVDLLHGVMAWSATPLEESLALFPKRASERLREIEALPASIARWDELIRAEAPPQAE